MTFLKRLATTIVLFVFFFVVVYFAICIVGGAVSGAKAAINNPDAADKGQLGQIAGQDFVRNNLTVIFLSSLASSLIASVGLSFTGILPWCRKPQEPPAIPRV
jgi:hypothetical protein